MRNLRERGPWRIGEVETMEKLDKIECEVVFAQKKKGRITM